MSDSPDLIQPVIGFRAWVEDDGEPYWTPPWHAPLPQYVPRLVSAGAAAVPWRPGVMRAECRRSEYERCGYRGIGPGERILNDSLRDKAFSQVVGAIAAWGRIEVHCTGFRAEYARIVALAYPTYTYRLGDFTSLDALDAARRIKRRVELLGEVHGVEVVPMHELRQRARDFGISIPEEMRPTKEEELGEALHTALSLYRQRGLVGASKAAPSITSLARTTVPPASAGQTVTLKSEPEPEPKGSFRAEMQRLRRELAEITDDIVSALVRALACAVVATALLVLLR